MIKIKKLASLSNQERKKLFYRFGEDFSSIMVETVIPIVNEIKKDGDKAVRKYTKKFDKAEIKNLLVSKQEIEASGKKVCQKTLKAFLKAKKNIIEYHSHQKKDNISYFREPKTQLGLFYHPIEKAAIYVPGGKASYPSSILMGVIPAKIAGVKDISVITPPDKKGKISDLNLALCKELGVNQIIKAGGVQGVAAAALGTKTIKKVDIIVGPGNIYVAAAKAFLFSLGLIQIDSIAGPSEVLIIADSKANPKWIAYDLLSQAEHEEKAIPLLLTTSKKLAENVKKEIKLDLAKRKGRHQIKQQAIKDNGLILIVKNLQTAFDFSNKYAPEHLQLVINQPKKYLKKIKNAGSLFLGNYTPVAVGDYFSGTNHILPTGGAARFSSGTSVDTFLRKTFWQSFTKKSLALAQKEINLMSKAEGFDDKHGGSVDVRLKNRKD